jgi:hypothetical protein
LSNWFLRGARQPWMGLIRREERRTAGKNGWQPDDRSGFTSPIHFRFHRWHQGGSGGGNNQVTGAQETEIKTLHKMNGAGRSQ